MAKGIELLQRVWRFIDNAITVVPSALSIIWNCYEGLIESYKGKITRQYCGKSTPTSGDSSKGIAKRGRKACATSIISIVGIVVTIAVPVTQHIVESYRSLEGVLSSVARVEKAEGVTVSHGDEIHFTAIIQNEGNNPVSIKEVYLALDNNERIELAEANRPKSNDVRVILQMLLVMGIR